MDPAEAEALFARTLLGDSESEDAWDAISTLRMNGSREIFDRAAAWCGSEDPKKRDRGAAILCQLRRGPLDKPEFLFRDESYSLIVKMLETERDRHALDSEIAALGHLYTEAAVPVILRYLDHADQDIRFAVACALGHFPNDRESVRGLLKLTSDSCAEVRDWAVFGLGVLGDVDSPEIREALLRSLDDENQDVREEAAVGLGKRRDERLLPKLRTMLGDPDFTIRVAQAASALLALDEDPPEWVAADYLAALNQKLG